MSQQHQRPVAESGGRADAMHRTIDEWPDEFADLTDEGRASERFQACLDVQSRFHEDYFQIALLIKPQVP